MADTRVPAHTGGLDRTVRETSMSALENHARMDAVRTTVVDIIVSALVDGLEQTVSNPHHARVGGANITTIATSCLQTKSTGLLQTESANSVVQTLLLLQALTRTTLLHVLSRMPL
ncbi:uncharacterized protein LOC144923499 [Branchiostoma floridae x Branchiostoma belcheri]